jgi:hypothetical protein
MSRTAPNNYARSATTRSQYLGPLEVDFIVDNNSIAAWGMMSDQGIGPHQAIWMHGIPITSRSSHIRRTSR